MERVDLEIAARGCVGPQRDPWDGGLVWDECPAKAAMKHPDVDAAMTVKGLAAVSPIAGWPDSISGRVVETIAAIDGERAALRAPAVQDG